MKTKLRLTVSFLNNLKSNPANAKSTDYEINLSAMKDSGLPVGVRCLVGKRQGSVRYLLRYTSSVTGRKASVINTDGPDYFYAATVNKSNHVFGKYCYFESGQCLYLTGVDITCTTGNQYPVLINTDTGSLHANLHCGDKVDGQNVLVFDNFDEIESAAKKSKQIGIAIPMENGRFKVSRFSMSGSSYSLDEMIKQAEKHFALSTVDSEFL